MDMLKPDTLFLSPHSQTRRKQARTRAHTHTQMLCWIILTPYSDLKVPHAITVRTVQFRQGQLVG